MREGGGKGKGGGQWGRWGGEGKWERGGWRRKGVGGGEERVTKENRRGGWRGVGRRYVILEKVAECGLEAGRDEVQKPVNQIHGPIALGTRQGWDFVGRTGKDKDNGGKGKGDKSKKSTIRLKWKVMRPFHFQHIAFCYCFCFRFSLR